MTMTMSSFIFLFCCCINSVMANTVKLPIRWEALHQRSAQSWHSLRKWTTARSGCSSVIQCIYTLYALAYYLSLSSLTHKKSSFDLIRRKSKISLLVALVLQAKHAKLISCYLVAPTSPYLRPFLLLAS